MLCLDKYFGYVRSGDLGAARAPWHSLSRPIHSLRSVCELDLVFKFFEAYSIIDEILLNGHLQESRCPCVGPQGGTMYGRTYFLTLPYCPRQSVVVSNVVRQDQLVLEAAKMG